MTAQDDENISAEIDEALGMLGRPTSIEVARRDFTAAKQDWKTKDPESYKKDMEEMCRKIFGDNWEVEYQLMLKEEFPEDD